MTSPAHRRGSGGVGEHHAARWLAVAAGTAVVAAGVAAAVVLGSHSSGASTAGTTSATRTGRSATRAVSAPSTTTAPIPLTVASISPAPAATGVATDSSVVVTFSEPLAPGAPDPTLTPTVAGQWSESGRTMVFHPSGGYVPSTTVKVTVPAGTTAVEGSHTVRLGSAYHSSFAVQSGSIRRLQELLAELNYLPLRFTPAAITTDALNSGSTSTTSAASAATNSALASEPTVADEIQTSYVPGSFQWAYPNIPAALKAQWKLGVDTEMVRGAVMTFEAVNGLAVDGIAGPEVWTTLVHAVAARQVDPHPYNYIEVSEALPETLRVWQDGKIVFTSLANTGVPGADTQLGTYPIYTHEAVTTMKGTDVNGTKYDVVVHDVGYFYGGDAVHGYPRASYGFPQSNGCVELPEAAAATIFNADENYYGVLVTVNPA
jgi:peptidoglycan hydrolase-like protein with peptidoglycan-binding domain